MSGRRIWTRHPDMVALWLVPFLALTGAALSDVDPATVPIAAGTGRVWVCPVMAVVPAALPARGHVAPGHERLMLRRLYRIAIPILASLSARLLGRATGDHEDRKPVEGEMMPLRPADPETAPRMFRARNIRAARSPRFHPA